MLSTAINLADDSQSPAPNTAISIAIQVKDSMSNLAKIRSLSFGCKRLNHLLCESCLSVSQNLPGDKPKGL